MKSEKTFFLKFHSEKTMLARDLCIVSNDRQEHFLAVREKKNAKSRIVPTLWASKVEGTKLNITPILYA